MVRDKFDYKDPTKMYGDVRKQSRKTLLPIAGQLWIMCSVRITFQNRQQRSMIVEGTASSKNVKKYIRQMYDGAMKNAMYKATDKAGKTGVSTKVERIYSQKLLYPNTVNLKIKRLHIDNKYYNEVKVNNTRVSLTRWSPRKEKNVDDFVEDIRRFDQELISDATLERRQRNQQEFFDRYN